MPQHQFPVRIWSSTALGSAAVLTSPAINCQNASPNFLMFRVTNVGFNADVKIEIMISNDGVTFNTSTSQDAIITSTNTVYGSQNPEDYHNITCPAAPWIQIQVTEIGTSSGNVVDATLWMEEWI